MVYTQPENYKNSFLYFFFIGPYTVVHLIHFQPDTKNQSMTHLHVQYMYVQLKQCKSSKHNECQETINKNERLKHTLR